MSFACACPSLISESTLHDPGVWKMITQLGRRSMLGFAGATVRPAGSSPGVTQALRRPLRVPAPILAASASAGALGPASTSLSSTAGARRLLFLAPSPVRHAANPQSGKPASDNVGHMVQNIKEEAKSVTSSVESSVAGSRKGAEETKQSNEIVDDAVRACRGEMMACGID